MGAGQPRRDRLTGITVYGKTQDEDGTPLLVVEERGCRGCRFVDRDSCDREGQRERTCLVWMDKHDGYDVSLILIRDHPDDINAYKVRQVTRQLEGEQP